jgi:hypothetical protein
MRSCLPYFVALLMMAPLAAAAEDFPVPPASRKNDSLGGATTLAPGKNYTQRTSFGKGTRITTIAGPQ